MIVSTGAKEGLVAEGYSLFADVLQSQEAQIGS